jgi:hypothetical protein
MIQAGHLHSAKLPGQIPNARIIRGDDDFRQRSSLLASFDDVLEERLARNGSQRFAGKSRGGKAGGNDANDSSNTDCIHIEDKISLNRCNFVLIPHVRRSPNGWKICSARDGRILI